MATMEAVAPLANDPIMLERLIRSLTHLEHQNLSIILDSIGRARMVHQLWRIGTEQRRSKMLLERLLIDFNYIRAKTFTILMYILEYMLVCSCST